MLGNKLRFKKTIIRKKDVAIENPKLTSAKQFPIENMYSGTLKKMGKILMGNCPFHTDPSPSFAIYPETNTYHCFGCNETGDSISFYMKQNEVDFQAALEALAG